MSSSTESGKVAADKTLKDNSDKQGWGEALKIIFHAVIIAAIVRIVLFQPFNIPSGSMIPTLLVGDYLFVSKYSYGYSRYSLPFGVNLFKGRIWKGEPKRGDVAVFKLPKDNTTDYIKRVIGLPGDRVKMQNGVLFLNGKAIPKKPVEDFVTKNHYGNEIRIPQFVETLPNGVKYKVLDLDENGHWDTTGEYVVPEGHYFMMGDNRDNSQDSRVSWEVGFVPLQNFVGKANYLFFSIDETTRWFQFWRWPFDIRWTRIFSNIHSMP